MRKALLSFPLVLLLFSCNTDKNQFDVMEGQYEGVFYRFSPDSTYDVANVSLLLADGSFEGSSDLFKYPLICEGTYTLAATEIEFMNSCGPWTADFDWTLILNGGPFVISQDEGQLILTKQYENGYYDRYELQLR